MKKIFFLKITIAMIVVIWEMYFALSPVSTNHVGSYTWFTLPNL